MKSIRIIHTVAAITFALFFIYSGARKFVPKNSQPLNAIEQKKEDQKKTLLINTVEANTFKSPKAFLQYTFKRPVMC